MLRLFDPFQTFQPCAKSGYFNRSESEEALFLFDMFLCQLKIWQCVSNCILKWDHNTLFHTEH